MVKMGICMKLSRLNKFKLVAGVLLYEPAIKVFEGKLECDFVMHQLLISFCCSTTGCFWESSY
jgi:hypothetical protein